MSPADSGKFMKNSQLIKAIGGSSFKI
jgi:hypothetical protein